MSSAVSCRPCVGCHIWLLWCGSVERTMQLGWLTLSLSAEETSGGLFHLHSNCMHLASIVQKEAQLFLRPTLCIVLCSDTQAWARMRVFFALEFCSLLDVSSGQSSFHPQSTPVGRRAKVPWPRGFRQRRRGETSSEVCVNALSSNHRSVSFAGVAQGTSVGPARCLVDSCRRNTMRVLCLRLK